MADFSSIWAGTSKPAVALQDPNESLRNMLAAQGGVLQNRLAQAQQLRGSIMQQAIDPQTGQYDPSKFNALAAANPDVGPAMADAVQQSQNLMGAQTEQGIRQQSYLNQVLPAALNLPADQRNNYLAGMLGGAMGTNTISRQAGANALAALPTDPIQQGNMLQAQQLATMSAPQQRAVTFGTPGTVNDGQNAINGTIADPSRGGGFAGGSATPVYPTRGELLTQTPGVGPDGRPTMQPLAGRAADQGRPDLAGPAGQKPGILPPGLVPKGYTGRYAPGGATAAPPAASADGGISAPPSSMPIPGPTGAVPTGMSPAQQAAQTAQGSASAAGFQDIANQGVQARQQNAILGNMLADTTQFTSGMSGANNAKRSIQQQAPAIAAAFGIKPEQIASLESFDKLANQIAGAQGAGSDARLLVAQGGNPSSHMSAAGVDQILRQLQGNADYIQARSNLAAKHPDQSDRAGFESGTGAQLDPRAFQFGRMTQPQRQAYVNSLSPTDKAIVQKAYNFAHSAGVLPDAASGK